MPLVVEMPVSAAEMAGDALASSLSLAEATFTLTEHLERAGITDPVILHLTERAKDHAESAIRSARQVRDAMLEHAEGSIA